MKIGLVEWMQQLANRMRRVRVCCGDWSRICTDGALRHGRIKGIFLDPPYSAEANRCKNIYREENLTVAHDVREWCAANGHRSKYRIALCGYDTEHIELEQRHGWRVVQWQAHGGYGNKNSQGNRNRHRERIWFSPHCLQPGTDTALFGRGN